MGPSSSRKRANRVLHRWAGALPRDRLLHMLISNRPARRQVGDRMGVKIAVVGGGSTYTPELIEGFANRPDRLPIDELVLLDVNPERLDVVGGLARRMLNRIGWGGRLVTSLDREA